MLSVQTKAYKKFDLALFAGTAAVTTLFLVNRSGSGAFSVIFGLTHLIYMLTVYFYLKQRSQVGASLISTFLFTANIAVLLGISGGLGSPYYGLWLLLILGVGIYRPSVPLALLALTTFYFAGGLISQDVPIAAGLVNGNIIALITTYLTGALGFWLWHTHHTRRQADNWEELSAQLSQEQLKSAVLLRHVGEGVIVVDHTGAIQLLNPAGAKILGWNEADARGLDAKLVMQLADESETPQTVDPLAQAMTSGTSVERDDVILNTKSGRKLSLALVASPISYRKGKIAGAIAVFRDISVAKNAARQRDEFISTASHEMRTPVAAVEGYVALALNPKVAQIDPTARDYLQKARNSIQHLGRLFQDLLTTTRIEEGHLPNHPEVFEVTGFLNQVIDEMRFKADAKGVNLELASTQGGGGLKSLAPVYYAYADPERLREVMTNLIDNALKYSVKTPVQVTISGTEEQVTVGVKDAGMGIAPEDLPHMFQKFYRVDNSQTRNIGGTGLGLYICRAIVEMYQGRIWVESKLGQGSHFKFSLPRLSYEKAQAMAGNRLDLGKVVSQQAAMGGISKPNPNKPKLVASPVVNTVE